MRSWSRARWRVPLELLVILLVGYLYSRANLLNFDALQLQQSGEHNESATLPLLAEIGLQRYGEIPLWNHYMSWGYPHAGDFLNHFWHPVATLPVLIWGGINGMKVSVFLALVLGGIGQWLFTHVMGGRTLVRLWSALLFMLSGGLVLLWRSGWYELLLGACWFPWCYAGTWWALQRRDRTSVVLAALAVAMVLTTGGGYYPVYLYLSSLAMVGGMLIFAPGGARWRYLRRALAIGALGGIVCAVMLLPWLDTFRYAVRQAPPDFKQTGSLRVMYALFTYAIGELAWNDAGVLGGSPGFNYFYIGALPLIGLALVPLALRERARRPALVTVGLLFAFLIMWHANRHTPMKWFYDLIPFMYNFRFPARLLFVATSPLLVLAALALQHLAGLLRAWGRSASFSLPTSGRGPVRARLPLLGVNVLIALVLFLSARDVLQTNQANGFAEQRLDKKSFSTLRWLKQQDPGLYYTNIGGDVIWWWWTPAAYTLELPVGNFIYNRFLRTYPDQIAPDSPFYARPKYQISGYEQPLPPDAQLLRDVEGVGVWYLPDALPFAFSADNALISARTPLNPGNVAPLSVRYDGPNRVVVSGTTPGDSQLVVLVSDYPGWQVAIDGEPATLAPVNGFLGVRAPPGEHTYVFSFRPSKHYLGLAISLLTLCLMAVAVLHERAVPPQQDPPHRG